MIPARFVYARGEAHKMPSKAPTPGSRWEVALLPGHPAFVSRSPHGIPLMGESGADTAPTHVTLPALAPFAVESDSECGHGPAEGRRKK